MRPDAAPFAAWHVRQLVDLAYELATVGDALASTDHPVDDAALFDLWQAVRNVAGEWQRRLQQLDRHREANWARTWCDDLTRLGHEVFAAELLFRVWGTILAAQDKRRDAIVARPILDHVVFLVQHARSKVMELVVHAGEPVAALDRFRRRCERWTDMLIGPVLARYGTAAYAQDARRAWEFGEELLESENVPGAEQLREAGYRTAFSEDVLNTAATAGWQEIVEAILDGCSLEIIEHGASAHRCGSRRTSGGLFVRQASPRSSRC